MIVFISDKVDFQTRNIVRNKEVHFIILKGFNSSRGHVKVYLTTYPIIFKALKIDLPGVLLLSFRKSFKNDFFVVDLVWLGVGELFFPQIVCWNVFGQFLEFYCNYIG